MLKPNYVLISVTLAVALFCFFVLYTAAVDHKITKDSIEGAIILTVILGLCLWLALNEIQNWFKYRKWVKARKSLPK